MVTNDLELGARPRGLSGNILVTGGAGFLGRGLLRRADRDHWNVDQWTVLSRDDAKHAALQARYPDVDCILGDVAGMPIEELALLMRGFDVVIHAAASKYVDRAEGAAFDTARTNVEGSTRVARAAIYARVPTVVGISTDKAAAPVNTYGMTKGLMERLFQEANGLSAHTRFHLCRYGNVIGSTGSAIPRFMKSAEEGIPIRLTDPLMTRFWMSVDEAVDVIVRAVDDSTPGTVLIPPMRAMQMQQLVRMALGEHEYGPLPGEEQVIVIGMRAGEKRHETILQKSESVRSQAVGGGWYEISPPTASATEEKAFELTSAQPPGGWMGLDAMREYVLDAATV
jgi:FlaA1/EpsC-like NDP-sugar epimerase